MNDTAKQGYALRVGNEVWVPPNATSADHDAAWAMMSPDERERTAKRIVRDLKWTVWQMKHPRLTTLLASACWCGLAMISGRVR